MFFFFFQEIGLLTRYRLAVIKALPNLEKLDDKIVTPEEVHTAILRGKTLTHPMTMMQAESSSPLSGRGSPEVIYLYLMKYNSLF